jgi:hypothetical protein
VISREIKGNTGSISFECYSRQAVLKASKKTNSQSSSSFEQYISLQLPIKLDDTLNITILSAPAKSNPTLTRISEVMNFWVSLTKYQTHHLHHGLQ